MRILVIGATGTVGGAVARLLSARGIPARALLRSPGKAASLPGGITAVPGDLQRPETLPEAFAGTEAVFLVNFQAEDETAQGLAGVEAAVAAGARRIVYLSVGMPAGSEIIPHFASKLPIEGAVRRSGVAHVILRPNNFYQNDGWFRPAIVDAGIYPQPIGSIGLSRVDVGDIAECAVRALLGEAGDAETLELVGPEVLNGEATAAAWQRHLGRPVRYAGDDLEAWAAGARTMLPERLVHDFAIMYRYFQERGWAAPPGAVERLTAVLGRPPRSFDDYVARTAAEWRAG